MPTLTLADLRTAQTRDDIRTRVLARLATAGLSTSDWAPSSAGGVENSIVDAMADAIEKKLAAKMADAISGRFLDFATGDFLKVLARRYYKITPRDATFTVENVRLSLVETASQQDFEPGDLWVVAKATGHRYQSITGGSLAPGRILDLQFRAELPGSAFSDVAGTIDTMVTAPAGVSCINVRPKDFVDTRLTGTSTGSVSATFADPDNPPTFDSIRIRIRSSGEVGSATFDYSLDAGGTWSALSTVPPVFAGIAGATLTFANGIAPSFIVGDIFTLLVASAILTQGTDAESDESIRIRCRARRASLSDVPVGNLVRLWAFEASQEVNRAEVDADPNTPGSIIVTIASHAGPASPQAVLDVTDFIAPRLLGYKGVQDAGAGSPEEKVIVKSATRVQITAGGTVTVPRAKVASVQAAADLAWVTYLQSVAIGPSAVRLSELEQAIMDAGAINAADLTLNGVADNGTILAGQVVTPADGTSLATSLAWRPI